MLPSKTLATGLVLFAAAAAAQDPALQGCWRSQQIQVSRVDGSRVDQNGDCASEYTATHARSRCQGETGETETVSSYESIAPGRLRVTVIDPATGKPKGPASELSYKIDEDWLIITRPLAANPSAKKDQKQPVSLTSVSIRVPPGADGTPNCRPRGSHPLRVGRTSVSSLALTLPTGWEPWLVDPTTHRSLGPAVGTSFFIGIFVPRTAAALPPTSILLVLVLDDVRFGPAPVRAAEFVAVKKRFFSELEGRAQPTCDLPDRACAIARLPEGPAVYTELFHVNGRVAIVSATMPRPPADSLDQMRNAVQPFVDRLRADNAR